MTNNIVKNITVPVALKYALLPGLIPRIVEIWRSGFSTVALLMAQIFFNIGLLPIGHTYLKGENFGKFGVLNVLVAAKHNLIFDRKHLDQIVVFGLISTAIFLIFAQIIALLIALLIPGAWAQLFTTQDPVNDIAFVLLDRIFGVPTINPLTGNPTGFFGSCVGDSTNDCIAMSHDGSDSATEVVPVPIVFPWPFHLALQQMFAFYSYSIAAIALFILLYFIATVILETAQSGTPFGKRFSRLWAPLRLIMAFGLIVPISNGLNLGQYGVLYSAKWGSSLATNVWQQFNTQLAVNGIMQADSMVGSPVANDAMEIVGYLHLANLCQITETTIFPRKYVHPNFNKEIAAYLINPNTDGRLAVLNYSTGDYQTYTDARAFSNGGDIIMRIGSMDPARYLPAWAGGQPLPEASYNEAGGVRPYCGQIIFPAVNTSSPGPALIQQKYYELIAAMWLNQPGKYSKPTCLNTRVDQVDGLYPFGNILYDHAQKWAQDRFSPVPALTTNPAPVTTVEQIKVDGTILLRQHLNCIIEAAVNAERTYINDNNLGLVPQELLDRGWAGAGIWYNRIAEINGALIDSINGMPYIHMWPLTMQRVAEMTARNQPNYIRSDLFNPDSAAFIDGAVLPRAGEKTAARAYYELYKLWLADGPGTGGRGAQGNTFEATIAWIFGIEGLYSMTDNTTDNVHPLAKLSGLGKSLIEGSIRNLSLGAGAMIADVVSGASNPLSGAGDFAGALGSALVSAASITLTAGFILFYIVPMLPFMYFFFAVGTWVKTVFEAMIGVPLWALSHLHIDGGGLPGQGAANGYYLLFEIFVRPVMIIMGFIAGITIFSAMSNVLIDVWNIVIANVGGSGGTEEALGLADSIRAPVDKMFYLVMFTMLLYMIGVSSFKLVDQIPQSILRWIGASIPTFVDQKEDITGSLVSKSSMYANRIFGGFTGEMTKKYKGIKQKQEIEAQYQGGIKREYGSAAEQQAEYRRAAERLSAFRGQADVPPDVQQLRENYPTLTRGIEQGRKGDALVPKS